MDTDARAGIVIRHEQMEYKTAVHHAYLVSIVMETVFTLVRFSTSAQKRKTT